MPTPQPGILLPVPLACRYLFLHARPGGDLRSALASLTIDDSLVVGIGTPVAQALGLDIPGLRPHPAWTGPGVSVPSTQAGLWLWLRGDDRGTLLHRSNALVEQLRDAFVLTQAVEGFRHREGR